MIPRVVTLCGVVAVLACLGACSSGAGSSSTASSGGSGGGGVTSAAAVASSSGASGGTSSGGSGSAALPSSCKDIPPSELLPYAKVALVQSFPRTTPGVTCEFASANGTQVVILTVGPGSTSSFAELEARTKTASVTTAALSGGGQEAFTISRGGKVAGVDALTSDDVTIALSAALPPGQVQLLAGKLASRY